MFANGKGEVKEVNEEDMLMTAKVVEEVEMKKQVDLGFKEFGRRIYLGVDYIKLFDSKVERKMDNMGEGPELEQFLNQLAGTDAAKNNDQ